MIVPIAHAMHWLSTLAYALPVVALVLFLVVAQIRDRSRS